MKVKRAMSLASLSLCMVGAAFQLSGCSSVPKPAEADGSSRVPANDATRVQALQQRVNADRQLLSENNLLRAQVDALQAKLIEMTTIVRDALLLPPPAPPAPPVQPAPAPVQPPPVSSSQSSTTTSPNLPSNVYAVNHSGVVIRVFHPWARTDFEPSDQVAQALRLSVRGAERIEVRGHTDSNVVNAVDKLIAIERAEKARTWLINNGADASKIRTKYFTAGNFFAENHTPQGRSVNRRVEIDIHNQQLGGNNVASGA